LVHCSLSGFTRNDQAAAPEVLALARRGDLLIRDLGYFVLPVLAALESKGIAFLSRFKHGVGVYDLNGQRLNLVWELKTHGRFDREESSWATNGCGRAWWRCRHRRPWPMSAAAGREPTAINGLIPVVNTSF